MVLYGLVLNCECEEDEMTQMPM
ncbi:MAG: hypothetical protein QOD63_1593, partial [Actinomycetota bacterium]|nr:hypothetical protein [Actinomycetota bacterium]